VTTSENIVAYGGLCLISKRFDSLAGVYFAEKKLQPKFSDKRNYQKLLSREFEILSALQHPAVPKVSRLLEKEGDLRLQLEWIPGVTVAEWLPQLDLGDARLLADFILPQLVDVLAYLRSKKLIHGDLCLENLMLTPEGQLKLIDFGVARYEEESSSDFPRVRGRDELRAPEIRETGSTSLRADVYAAGVIYERMLGPVSGQTLLQRENLDVLKTKRELPILIRPKKLSLLIPKTGVGAVPLEETHCEMHQGRRLVQRIAGLSLAFLMMSVSPIGKLSINSLPASQIALKNQDGQILFEGETPLPDLRLARGNYHLVFKNQFSPRIRKKSFRIQASDDLKLFEDLRKLDTL
jgi:serine/threonine protein kinase